MAGQQWKHWAHCMQPGLEARGDEEGGLVLVDVAVPVSALRGVGRGAPDATSDRAARWQQREFTGPLEAQADVLELGAGFWELGKLGTGGLLGLRNGLLRLSALPCSQTLG